MMIMIKIIMIIIVIIKIVNKNSNNNNNYNNYNNNDHHNSNNDNNNNNTFIIIFLIIIICNLETMFAPGARAALGPAPSPPLTGTCSTRTGSWASRGTTGRNTHMGGGGCWYK